MQEAEPHHDSWRSGEQTRGGLVVLQRVGNSSVSQQAQYMFHGARVSERQITVFARQRGALISTTMIKNA